MCELICKAPTLNYTPVENQQTQIKDGTSTKKEIKQSNNFSSDNFQVENNTGSSSNSEYVFIDIDSQVCTDKNVSSNVTEIIQEENEITLDEKKHVDPLKFTSTRDNSNVLVQLKVNMEDHNGFNNRAKTDITGTIEKGSISLNKDLFLNALSELDGTYLSKGGWTDTDVKVLDTGLEFRRNYNVIIGEPPFLEPYYKINIFADIPFIFNDKFGIEIKTEGGKLIAQLDGENWVPDSTVLNKLEGAINNKLQEQISSNLPEEFKKMEISFNIKKDEDNARLIITPEIKNLSIPVKDQATVDVEEIDGSEAKFYLDDSGNIVIGLDGIEFVGSSTQDKDSEKMSVFRRNISQNTDKASVEVKLGLQKDGTKQIYANGNIEIDIDSSETKKIELDGNNLNNYIDSGKLINEFSLYTKLKSGENPEIESNNYVSLKNAKVGDKTVNLETSLKLNFDSEGITLTPMSPDYKQIDLGTTQNGVELYINGPQYFEEMKNMINSADKSINLETYIFGDTSDNTTNEIAYLMAKKASGIEITNGSINLENKDGVEVKVLFNSWKGSRQAGKESEETLLVAKDKIKEEINNSSLSDEEKLIAIKNLDKNLNWKFFTEDVLRSDHRKVFVVDGSFATVGGMNMSDKYLGEDSHHDVMLKIAGPEVRNVHKEFLENWYEFNGMEIPKGQEWNNLLKSQTELENELFNLQANGQFSNTANIGVLVTDDKQADIERGILKLIDEADKEINIEQAFFSYSSINEKLQNAIERGVKVNIVIAKESLIDLFDDANLYSIYQLSKAKGAENNLNIYFYEKEGNHSKHIHTKAITIDGDKGIIGSANMIGRSLKSPFVKVEEDNSHSQILYNKELSLYLENPDFIYEVNSRLFEEDMVHNTTKLSLDDIRKLVEKAGGEKELKKKALLATLT